MKRSEKINFVQNLKEELNNSTSVIVSHYAGLNVKETDELRKAMRKSRAKFKVTKNRLAKIAITDTQYENIANLFNGPTAVAYSADPVAPAKISVEFEKKFKNFKILGGSFEGEKLSQEKINFLGSLPSLDEIRGKLVGFLLVPAQNIVSVLQAPAGQIARLLESRSQKLGKSN